VEKKDIEYFKEFLQNRLEELLDHADGTVSGMIAPKGNFPDPADRASLETDRNFMTVLPLKQIGISCFELGIGKTSF